MKFSKLWLYKWLYFLEKKDFLDKIVTAGFEINSITPVSDFFDGVVIGKILRYKNHPIISKFKILTIDIGDKKSLNIVSKNINCKVSSLVVVAPKGIKIPKEKKIKYYEKFNITTDGILCSLYDLGISKNKNDREIELPSDAPIGENFYKYFYLDDQIIDISIPYNRSDCLCLLGISRDIAALNKISIKYPDNILSDIKSVIYDTMSVVIDQPSICPRYIIRIIKNININLPTPIWMVEKLRCCGIDTVNIIIDISNYVMIELGQPIRIFDLDKILDNEIIIRYAKNNEIINLINGKKIFLTSDIPVISDKEKILSIPGIIESIDSSIDINTKNILIESAFFDPQNIIKCSRFLNIYTDHSYRYERGVDFNLQQYAINRITFLLIDLCNGVPGPIKDVVHQDILPEKKIIKLSKVKLNKIIGCNISNVRISVILNSLNLIIKKKEKKDFYIKPPSWRFDIQIEEDIIEEILRIYGYDNIPNIPMKSNFNFLYNQERKYYILRVKNLLMDRGYQEIITYSFVNPKMQGLFYPEKKFLYLSNPISIEMSVMRSSLWTGLLSSLLYNKCRQQKSVRFFESGFCFIRDNNYKSGIRQEFVISGIIFGDYSNNFWEKDNFLDFYDIKGDVEAIFESVGKIDDITFKLDKYSCIFHPKQNAKIFFRNIFVGSLGAIHPAIIDKLNISEPCFMFEILWNRISKLDIREIQHISLFPMNKRDITMIFPEFIKVSDIIFECKKNNGIDYLIDIKLSNIYRDKYIKKGFKSVTFSLYIQSKFKTLREKEIHKTVLNCVNILKKKFNAYLKN